VGTEDVAERRQCEFFLIRYVSDAVKNEFVNIGVLLREGGQTEVRFTRDWQRVRCVDPDADTAMLEALEVEVRQRLAEVGGHGLPVMKTIEDSFSNSVQMTEAKACLAESIPAEMEQLMRLYVEQQKRPRETRKSGRGAILNGMRNQFDRAGVWDLMRKRIAASAYTMTGDPLRIDCGYRPNGVVRMFHAVSLDADAEMAKVLAFSASRLTEGVARVEKAKLELTAIIEPLEQIKGSQDDEDRIAQYRFAVETMEHEAIRVLTTSDLVRVAETARRELRV
jgi:Protein of unknown function (DUF3037)